MASVTITFDELEAAAVATAVDQRIERLERLAQESRQWAMSGTTPEQRATHASAAIHYVIRVRRLKPILRALVAANVGDLVAARAVTDTVWGDGAPALTEGE